MAETTTALIPCPACAREVSPSAATCPQCGHPLTQRKAGGTPAAAKILIALGILAVIGSVVLQAAPYANVFHLYLARLLLWGGLIVAGVGALVWLLNR